MSTTHYKPLHVAICLLLQILLVLLATSRVSAADQTQLPNSVEVDSSTGETIVLNPNTSTVPNLLMANGVHIRGLIPLVFEFRFRVTNNSPNKVQYTIPTGTMYIEAQEPLKYQFVTTLLGFARTVGPGGEIEESFFAMCADRPGAVPLKDRVMVAVGRLPDETVKVLERWRDRNDATQAQTRSQVIDAINASTLAWIQAKRARIDGGT